MMVSELKKKGRKERERDMYPVLRERLLSSERGEEFARKAISGGREPCIIFEDLEPIVREAC
jgi:hypothetical protein